MKKLWLHLAVFLLTAFLLAVSASAAEKSISLPKTEFTQNENIFVTAVGEGNDWVGLYLRGETPGQSACIYWYYVAQDAESGEAVDIRETRTNGQTEYEEIPPGEYTMWLLLDDGYEPFDSVDFTVIATLELNQYSYKEGEDILVTAYGEGKDWVGVYLKGEVPGSGPASIYWYYVADGHTPMEPVNIREGTHNDSRSDLADLPAGEYTMFLLADDGYEVIDSVDFKITGDKKAAEPAKAEEPVETEAPAPEEAPAEETPAAEAADNGETPEEPEPSPAPTPAPEEKKTGCSSSVGGGMIVLLAVLGSARIAKRKN